MDDIYFTGRNLARLRAALPSDQTIAPADRAAFCDFLTESRGQGLSDGRVYKYAYTLRLIAREFSGPVTDATLEKVREFVWRLDGGELSPWSKRDRKIVLKVFLRWWRRSGEDYPPEVAWLHVRDRNLRTKLPEDLLTIDELDRILRQAGNPRDRAFLSVLYEGGFRIGELLTARVGSVQPADDGAKIVVNGKTGGRRPLLIASAPYLFDWINAHPASNDPNAPLWVGATTSAKGRPLYYQAARKLVKRTAKAAGVTKRVHPHLFRHTRATHLARRLPDGVYKAYLGWSADSRMPKTYVHLSGQDSDDGVRALHGLPARTESGSTFEAKPCPRCRAPLRSIDVVCRQCWLALNPRMSQQETVEAAGSEGREARDLMAELVKNPLFLQALAQVKAARSTPPGAAAPTQAA